MMNPTFASNCPLQQGDWWTADSTRGITLDTTALGNIYYDIPYGNASKQVQKPRLVMLVKNSSSSTLARNLFVDFATSAGSFPKIITGLAANATPCVGGVVEDGYIAGVPDGAIFRVVISGQHYIQMKTGSDSKVTTAPGDNLVIASSGEVWKDTGPVVAYQMTATTNGVDNGLQVLAYVQTVLA